MLFDVIGRRKSRTLDVRLNGDLSPLIVNKEYERSVNTVRKITSDSQYIITLQEAKWFITAYKVRNETLLKVFA